MSQKQLTKSLFKSALECPTKLYYAARPLEYANQRAIDPFLEALADGGYQVGELAKQSFMNGVDLSALSPAAQIAETRRLLQQERVILFEAAILYNNLFVRIDILIKEDDQFQLIEVKAKSYDEGDKTIMGKRGGISAQWLPYIEDVAYQAQVLRLAYPQAVIQNFLMLVNKNAVAGTTGINQKFVCVCDHQGKKTIRVSDTLSAADLQPELLIKVAVDDAVKQVFEERTYPRGSFTAEIDFLAEQQGLGRKIPPELGGHCKKCEFKCSGSETTELKSGFKECWQAVLGWDESDFLQPTVLEISRLGHGKLDDWLARGLAKIADITVEDLPEKPGDGSGLSQSQRQWLQINKVQQHDDSPFVDLAGLKAALQPWVFPLHFIDFETAQPAIPFVKGRHPYESVAFQFSHHRVDADGTVSHVGQYLNVEPGEFPNFDFVRQLRDNLSHDAGTIFQYSTHENTILNKIAEQLGSEANPPKDREVLLSFIHSITQSSTTEKPPRRGPRSMVDLCELVKKYYYDPVMHGSNSLKYVLPAVLNGSSWLQARYSKPIYGAVDGIASLNFRDWTWLQTVDGKITNPYDRLPKLFEGLEQEKLDFMTKDNEIRQGGAALTAYGRLQFSEMSPIERDALSQGLLKYCELDTLAMVMLYEAWREWVG